MRLRARWARGGRRRALANAFDRIRERELGVAGGHEAVFSAIPARLAVRRRKNEPCTRAALVFLEPGTPPLSNAGIGKRIRRGFLLSAPARVFMSDARVLEAAPTLV